MMLLALSALFCPALLLGALPGAAAGVPPLARPTEDPPGGPAPGPAPVPTKAPLPSHRPLTHRRFMSRHQWLLEALAYLRQFGYFDDRGLTRDNVVNALMEFQDMAGLKQTGRVDRHTIDAIHKPRCGNPDPAGAKPTVRVKRYVPISKWESQLEGDTLKLKWNIQSYTKRIANKAKVKDIVRKAFDLWRTQSAMHSTRAVKLQFEEAASAADADINIMWAVDEHGDDKPFDGRGRVTNVLAHTYYPNYPKDKLNGDIHLDDAENWVLSGSSPGSVHLPYVLVHEIGHALGLGHSRQKAAVMNAIYQSTELESISLHQDDKCGINVNYLGPVSRMCTLVLLFSEIMPRREQTFQNEIGVPIDSTSRLTETTALRPASFESAVPCPLDRRVDYHPPLMPVLRQVLGGVWQCFIQAAAPYVVLRKGTSATQKCSDDAAIQSKFEHLMKNQFDIPSGSEASTTITIDPSQVCVFVKSLNLSSDGFANDVVSHMQEPHNSNNNARRRKRNLIPPLTQHHQKTRILQALSPPNQRSSGPSTRT